VQPYSLAYEGTSVLATVDGETVESTYRHPYWVVRGEALESRPWLEHLAFVPKEATTPGRWVDSCDLRAGDQVMLRDGRVQPVELVAFRPFDGTVYNMEVEELQCYAVGRNGVLVHNNNSPETGPTGGPQASVQPYEVDTYGNLRARSAPGDGLALDHQPSNASNIARAETKLGRSLTPTERAAVRDQGPAVAIPEELHPSASPTYGGRNTPAQIAADAANPVAAVIRDSQAMIDAASGAYRGAAEAAAAILRALAGG
jgi:hypothetical protein